jgi:hypothetical protein
MISRRSLLWKLVPSLLIICFTACERKVVPAGFATQSFQAGAYYFDGWTGKTFHISEDLRDNYPERKPVWGWVTSTPAIMKEQIDLAADAGLSFFNFCWYYNKDDKGDPETDILNQALGYFRKAPNRSRLKYCLMVANHEGYIVGPEEWPVLADYWTRLFKEDNYLRVDGKPYISFFDIGTLMKKFGSADEIKKAFDQLRQKAADAGLPGVTIGVASGTSGSAVREARRAGFDLVMSYNDHEAGFRKGETVLPISSQINSAPQVWDRLATAKLPYIPTVTLNWDLRPWSPPNTVTPRYTGYGGQSVYESVQSVKKWITEHPRATPKDKIFMLYAWNEYGEGSWLTPSVPLKDSLLQGLKRALVP